ncbi:MAG: hypothetical protein Q9204_006020 [Flavoplaca sp. TL-2023a]
MRLLHTERLDFQEFFDSQTPKYAILSHRWTGNEVSFQDFDHCKEEQRPNFDKISNCCSLAKNNGYEWVWIDTCCIDKKSSAELSEAINSMYAWYEKADVCYVYLVDVSWSGDWETTREEFRGSAWFTRGWTLQELLAPKEVMFFDLDWKLIGNKNRSYHGRSLNPDISDVTGISDDNLRHPPTSQCVARKLSWVSKRSTTRVEDMAYCMLGLCSVNMPLLYGEGQKAFLRLQSEIIKQSDDESIFAWFCDEEGRSTFFMSGLVAPSPRCFAESGQIVTPPYLDRKQPYSQTNKGLAYAIPRPRNWTKKEPALDEHYSLCLECSIESSDAKVRFSSVTIDVVFYESSWRRLHTGSKTIVISDSLLWNKVTADESCIFETIYFLDRYFFIESDKEGFLRHFRLSERQIWTGPSGENFELRDLDWQKRQKANRTHLEKGIPFRPLG